MALKDFKVHSGIKQTKYPHAIGPLADTIVSEDALGLCRGVVVAFALFKVEHYLGFRL